MKKLILVLTTAFLLTGCASNKWRPKSNMDPVQAQIRLKEIEKDKALVNYLKDQEANEIKGGKNKQSTISTEINQGTIALALDYQKAGYLDTARDVYQDFLKERGKSEAILNNLGRLYEQVGEYKKAIKYYQILIDTYNKKTYLYDITWAYIRAGDATKARIYYEQWKQLKGRNDKQIYKAIRAIEKAK